MGEREPSEHGGGAMEDLLPEISEDKPIGRGSQASRARRAPREHNKGTMHQSIFIEAVCRR